MNWKNRRIRMPGRFDPSRWEVTAGIGLREVVLLAVNLVQAIWLIFLNEAWPFALRLAVTVMVGLLLLGIAMVPIKDKPVEYYLFKFLRYKLRPPGRVYRTAQKGRLIISQEPATANEPEPEAAPRPARTKPPKPVRVTRPSMAFSLPAWLQPDVGLLLVVFVCVLIAGSVVAYVGNGGGLEPVRALATRVDTSWPTGTR
jgi:hypothetical protein